MSFKPLLAAAVEAHELHKIRFPVLASPKIDGIRVLIINGVAVTRSLKPVRNKYIQKQLGRPEYEGLDGEIVVGSLLSPKLFRETSSGVMSAEGEPDYCYLVFDMLPNIGASALDAAFIGEIPYNDFHARLRRVVSKYGEWSPGNAIISSLVGNASVVGLKHVEINNQEELMDYEQLCVALGFEGIMIRNPDGKYKFGRSTLNEGTLLKMKRFTDAEAIIIGFQERMHNSNEPTIDKLGYMKRTTHKENMIGRNDLGSLIVKDVITGTQFQIGSGFDDAERKEIWENTWKYLGRLVKYRYMGYGDYGAPRFPTFEGIRDE